MIDRPKVEQAVRLFLEAIGEDPDREGLRETPARVASMCQEIFCGLWEDPQVHLQTVISEEHDEMILVKDIPLYAICEHHLLPFFGKAHVAYILNMIYFIKKLLIVIQNKNSIFVQLFLRLKNTLFKISLKQKTSLSSVIINV